MDKDKNYNDVAHKRTEYDLIREEDVKLFMTELPEAPDKTTIKRLLIQLPQQITFIDEKALILKKELGDRKVILKIRKNDHENQKSEIRKRELDKYQKQDDEFIKRTQDLMRELMKNKDESAAMKKMYFQEISKVIRPDKPTKSELDDIANIQTLEIQNNINNLEKEISDISFELEVLETKKDFYENIWISIRNYQKIVVAEMHMLGEH